MYGGYGLKEVKMFPAVIISKIQNKYVFCKHKDRDTWEVPGGHRENEENIIDTAKWELYEETGALEYDIEPVCVYSVTAPDHLNYGDESFGMLFFADIQPHLINEAKRRGYL